MMSYAPLVKGTTALALVVTITYLSYKYMHEKHALLWESVAGGSGIELMACYWCNSPAVCKCCRRRRLFFH